MAQFLRDPKVLAADIIAIQEPWKNPFQDSTHHPAKGTHELLWPAEAETGQRARVCMYISKKLAGWTHYAHSGDLQEVRIRTNISEVRVFNVYNDQITGDGLNLLRCLVKPTKEQKGISYLIVGDFNLHHPVWGGDDAEEDAKAEEVLELMDTANLELWTEPGIPTRMNTVSQTTIDLVLASQKLRERLIACAVSEDTHADSDHLPIATSIDLETQYVEEARRRCWKAMDTEKFLEFVSANLLGKRGIREGATIPRQIDEATESLLSVIQQGVQVSTPWARPSVWAHPGWTPECTEAISTTRRLFRRWRDSKDDQDHQEYRTARNKKGKVIGRALRQGFRTWIKDTIKDGPRGLWRVSKWARNREASGGVIPALKKMDDQLAESNEEKAQVLREAFFPRPPQADLDDIARAKVKQQLQFPPISEQEVTDLIRRAPPDKAPGPDEIPNRVWKLALASSDFIRILSSIFDACVRTGYNPRHFQQSITVALRKGGPRNFRKPKSYRPIALMNTLGKLLEAVIASRISWAVEEHHLLPDTHLGGRKGISVDHTIQLILDRVHRAWGDGKKVSMLLLDVSGAYDNVSHQRLLHNMRMLGLGHFVPWVQSFLTGRSTRIKLPGFTSDLFATETGIPQGSPISPILFLLFNTPLVRGCYVRGPDGAECRGYGWVDDVAMIVESRTYARNVELLQQALTKADTWARRHAAKFAPDKFELIHFTNPRQTPDALPMPTAATDRQHTPDIYDIIVEDPGDDQMPVQTSNQTIQPSNCAKYLGIWLDKTLQFNVHRTKLTAKANGSLEALRGMTGSTWGAPLIAMRMVYQAVVVPQMLYGVAAWYSPAARTTTKPDDNRIINIFTNIQRRAAILIAGAFKSMSAAALNVELYLVPIRLQMQQIIEETAIRIQTGAKWAQPECLTLTRRPQDVKLGGLSPMEAFQKKGQVLERKPGTLWESRTAFVLAPWEPRVRCIIEDAEVAIKSHDEILTDALNAKVDAVIAEAEPRLDPISNPPTVFFTDGSGYEGMIGASAVAPQAEPLVAERQHLGNSNQSTVYIAELSGIEMAIRHFSKSNPQPPRELVIFADSQAAIQAVQNPKRPSGQYVLHAIYTHIRALTPGLSVTIRWIPAHVGVSGNELADAAAKEAAKGGAGAGAGSEICSSGSDIVGISPKLRLATTAKRQVRARIRAEWAKQWAKEKTGRPNHRLVDVPHKKVLKLFEGLSKPYTSILVQMRSMRIGLRHFLYKINEADSDRCSCEEGSQTPRHVLLQCPLYLDLRKTFMEKAKRTNLQNPMDYEAIMSHPQATRYVAEFMLSTGLLGQFRHCDVDPEPDEDNEPTNRE
ncbi:hypothetical protein N7490_006579 [Penicillium lividum]|nr:hypothetical protein N7490_006579 [Penicillium lividum]